jgi:hypothetical protein
MIKTFFPFDQNLSVHENADLTIPGLPDLTYQNEIETNRQLVESLNYKAYFELTVNFGKFP